MSSYSLDVKWLDSQWLGIKVSVAHVSFEPQWANPLWTMAGWPIDDAFQRVAMRLDDAVTESLAKVGLVRALSFDDLGEARWFAASWLQILWAWFGYYG